MDKDCLFIVHKLAYDGKTYKIIMTVYFWIQFYFSIWPYLCFCASLLILYSYAFVMYLWHLSVPIRWSRGTFDIYFLCVRMWYSLSCSLFFDVNNNTSLENSGSIFPKIEEWQTINENDPYVFPCFAQFR